MLNYIIKTFFMNLCITYAFLKISKYNEINTKIKVIMFSANMIITLIYSYICAITPNLAYFSAINCCCYLIYGIFVLISISKISIRNILLLALSISVTFVVRVLGGILYFGILKTLNMKVPIVGTIENILVGIIEIILVNILFRVRRFKDGFSFWKNKQMFKEKLLIIAISIFLLIFSIILGKKSASAVLYICCASILILGGIIMYIWIRKSITNYYKKRLKDRTVELQAEQLKEKDEKIAELQTELAGVLKINHKYNQRLSAMEDAVKKLGERINFSEEFANEYADVMNSVNEFSKEYKQELAKINKDELTKTNIYSIDSLLEFLNKEANDANIKFKLNVNGNINEMLEKFIQKNKLETLLADHVRDAIIAIKSSDNDKREILLNLGKYGDYYEVCIQDTGIEFEIDTLLKLGKEQVTTHKDEGGSGIGFVTTFETMRECKASLVIEENHPESKYTKSVIIRFDGKNEYRISSYRAIMIKDKNQDGRIIID